MATLTTHGVSASEFFEHTPDEAVDRLLLLLERLYQNGKTNEVLTAVQKVLPNLQLLAAWCLYREKKYNACHTVLSTIPESEKAMELWCYLFAYKESGFWDEQRLLETASKLPQDNFNRLNALMIGARQTDAKLDASQILGELEPWMANLDRSLATVEQSNLMHNAARLALEKRDFQSALKIINYAIEAYGTRTNWHHRAAAHFWKSDIYEKLNSPYDAWQAGQESLRLWQVQHDEEPSNSTWPNRLKGAHDRAATLRASLMTKANALELINGAITEELAITSDQTEKNFHHLAAAYELKSDILSERSKTYEAWLASISALYWRQKQYEAARDPKPESIEEVFTRAQMREQALRNSLSVSLAYLTQEN